MITEEALPTYMAMLNTLDGVRDETGAADTPWGRWNRAWTAEENRHGDLMNKYCYLSGRVNMKVRPSDPQVSMHHPAEQDKINDRGMDLSVPPCTKKSLNIFPCRTLGYCEGLRDPCLAL